MALEYLPDIFDPWTDEMLNKLTVHEVIFTHMTMAKRMKLLEKRVEKDPTYQKWYKEKYSKVLSEIP